MFSANYGMRNNTLKVLLLVTDGTESPMGLIDDPTSSVIKTLTNLGE